MRFDKTALTALALALALTACGTENAPQSPSSLPSGGEEAGASSLTEPKEAVLTDSLGKIGRAHV